MKKFLSDNWIVVLIALALVTSTTLAIRNNFSIEKNNQLQKETALVKQLAQQILSRTMHGLDLGVRGFGLTVDSKLLIPYNEAIEQNSKTFTQLDSLLKKQDYNDMGKLEDVRNEVDHYIAFSKQMVEMVRIGNTSSFVSMLAEDKGYEVWKKYNEFTTPLFKYEDELNNEALLNYNSAIRNNLLLQFLIIILALPALFLVVMNVRKERDARHTLLVEVEENDRKYVFNPGTTKKLSAKAINDMSIENMRKASSFIESMAKGEYTVEWNGLDNTNLALNKETLAGNLLNLREKLKFVKQQDEIRNSTNEGLAKFSEIVRNHQHDSKVLADKCVSFLSNTLNAQQASLFVLEDDGDEKNRYLHLAACYAFDKKKWIDKRVEIGSGMVGQAFLDGEIVRLKQVPKGYTAITSGLGDATPQNLIIVPLKYDQQTVALVELASFYAFEDYQVDFLSRAGEFLASAILNTQTTMKMKHLLEQAHQNEEEMRASEEEMRQNMEELQATQEELMRKEREMSKALNKVT